MTTIEIELPEDLAQRARNAGLFSDGSIQQLFEDAIRRRAGRALLDVAPQLHTAAIPPMSDAEVVAEVAAVRAERRATSVARPVDDAGGS